MTLKGVKTTLDGISKNLNRSQESREFLLKNSRDIINLCSQSIIAVHKGEFSQAKTKARMADSLLKKYRKKAKGDLGRYLITPEQEFVEASSLIAIAEKKQIPNKTKLGVSGEAYILGLLDCIGELKRLSFDKIRTNQAKEATRIFGIMEELYHLLYPFAGFDKVVKETRRKLDTNRILLEDVRSAVTEEIRRTDLINAIRKMKK